MNMLNPDTKKRKRGMKVCAYIGRCWSCVETNYMRRGVHYNVHMLFGGRYSSSMDLCRFIHVFTITPLPL